MELRHGLRNRLGRTSSGALVALGLCWTVVLFLLLQLVDERGGFWTWMLRTLLFTVALAPASLVTHIILDRRRVRRGSGREADG